MLIIPGYKGYTGRSDGPPFATLYAVPSLSLSYNMDLVFGSPHALRCSVSYAFSTVRFVSRTVTLLVPSRLIRSLKSMERES